MTYSKKTWIDRVTEFAGRRKLTPTGTADTYDVTRAEGGILAAGDPINADALNDLETRIANGLNEKIDATLADAADDILIATAADTWAKITLVNFRTKFMQATLDMARNILSRAIFKNYTETLTKIAAATGTVTLDIETGNNFALTQTGALTLAFTNWPQTDQTCSVTIKLTTGATPYALTLPAGIKWPNGTPPSGLTTANKHCYITLVTMDGGVTIDANAATGYAN